MAVGEIHENDVGTVLEATLKDDGVPVDVSTATTQEFVITRPDKSRIQRTTTFVTDGTDGKIQYVTVSTDLTPTGPYRLQAHIVLAAGDEFRTDILGFKVYPNL